MIDADVFDFIVRCDGYNAAAPLLDDLLATVGSSGFNHLILSGVPVGGQKLAPMVELNGWPPGWFERYIEQNHAAVDGVCLYSGRTMRPFFWSDVPGQLANTPESVRVAGEATDFGICSGFAVPMFSPYHWQSVLSFASPAKRCEISEREKARLTSMAVYAGMSVQAMHEHRMEAEALSDREREVLLWAAGGKSAWETSRILGIAERTVKKHEEAARRKFNVATTVQAVVEAIRRRAIHP